jgi:dienelactone hydrolase
MLKRFIKLTTFLLLLNIPISLYGEEPKTLPGTQLLKEEKPLDEVMVQGIQRFTLRALKNSSILRDKLWQPGSQSVNHNQEENSLFLLNNVDLVPNVVPSELLKNENRKSYLEEIAAKRKRFQKRVGIVDQRIEPTVLELVSTIDQPALVSQGKGYKIYSVRWQVTENLSSEGLFLKPLKPARARIIVVPDANSTPEMMTGLTEGVDPQAQLARRFAENGCEVLVPAIISRSHEFSGHPDVAYTNQPHREFIYRMAYVVGRSVIGYEVEKIQSAVGLFETRNQKEKTDLPIAVAGVGEGGLLAFYSAAMDQRIDASYICGYFTRRENVWKEPLYRNVWGLLAEFGDAEIAGLIAPRQLTIEANAISEVPGPVPPAVKGRRGGAAPGEIYTNSLGETCAEFDRAKVYYKRLGAEENLKLVSSRDGDHPAGSLEAIQYFLKKIIPDLKLVNGEAPTWTENSKIDPVKREKRLFDEMVTFTQGLIQRSALVRKKLWKKADANSVESWKKTIPEYKEMLWQELMGKFPKASLPFNPRTRLIMDEPEFWGYEVVLDVYQDVIASGVLLVPKNLKAGEKRPVVVCQHGLEGTPMDTITYDPKSFKYYKAFASELVKRGFIVFSPQNPYRGADQFRVIQRMTNPLKRSLFGLIIRQHEQTLDWLSSLSFVDQKRIAFYGLSYGGKTAVHVPPFLDRYCLSICSGDYNEWIKKLSSNTLPMSYIFTGEYEIWMWNMGHLANHAELANLMAPRPFMVERGHRDGVGIDEMVAAEYAKVRRHYDEMGIGDKTEIEYFNGPHRINAVGTFQFLHKHLDWPVPK